MGAGMSDIVQFVQDQTQLFNSSLSDEKIKWAKESQFAIQVLQENKSLRETAQRNQLSLQNAIINVAAVGISLNPANKHAYLVPRGNKVCLDISYMGLLHLAMATGSIMFAECNLVYANDEFKRVGVGMAPVFNVQEFTDRGAVVGAYCTVKTRDGDYLTEVMSLAEIKETESTSKAMNGPWKTHWGEMARKTVVKRASKYWPKVDRLDEAIHHLNTEGEEGLTSEKPVAQGINDDQVLELVGLCRDAGIELDVFCKKASVQNINEISESRFEAAKGWILKQVKS